MRIAIEDHQLGHRQRLRERFLKTDGEGIPDYELLELLLCLSQPRGDVKPTAKALLAHFKSLTALFQSPVEDFKRFKGVGDSTTATLRMIRVLSQRLAREALDDRPLLSSMEQVVRYGRLRLHDPRLEQFHVIFLDQRYQFITDIIHQQGTIDHTMVYPRELIKQALQHGASALLLIHNHPTGDCSPSQSDIDLTHYIQEAGAKLGLEVYDHIIISVSNHFSMRAAEII